MSVGEPVFRQKRRSLASLLVLCAIFGVTACGSRAARTTTYRPTPTLKCLNARDEYTRKDAPAGDSRPFTFVTTVVSGQPFINVAFHKRGWPATGTGWVEIVMHFYSSAREAKAVAVQLKGGKHPADIRVRRNVLAYGSNFANIREPGPASNRYWRIVDGCLRM